MADLAITFDIDATQALGMLHNAEKRVAYALVNALNDTAKDVQAAERSNVDRRLTVRKAEFIHREVAVISFASATKGTFQAAITVGNQRNPKQRLLLSKYEAGDARIGFLGGSVAEPVLGGARAQKKAGISPELTFSAMKLQQFQGGKRLTRKARGQHVRGFGTFGEFGRLRVDGLDKVQWRGAARTYLVPGVGVFQRTGGGSTKPVWWFWPSVRIPPSLHFLDVGRAVAETRFQHHLQSEVFKSLEYALQLRRFVA